MATGKSRTLRSRHLKGEALDFVPLDPATGKGRFGRALAIEVAAAFMDAGLELGAPVRWGGMWINFEDIPHIELAASAHSGARPIRSALQQTDRESG